MRAAIYTLSLHDALPIYIDNFQSFARAFTEASKQAGKPRQQLVPYFIASHPGSDLHAMIDLALFLKRNGYRPDRSEEHTSELQSRVDLVCRPLLERKKTL